MRCGGRGAFKSSGPRLGPFKSGGYSPAACAAVAPPPHWPARRVLCLRAPLRAFRLRWRKESRRPSFEGRAAEGSAEGGRRRCFGRWDHLGGAAGRRAEERRLSDETGAGRGCAAAGNGGLRASGRRRASSGARRHSSPPPSPRSRRWVRVSLRRRLRGAAAVPPGKVGVQGPARGAGPARSLAAAPRAQPPSAGRVGLGVSVPEARYRSGAGGEGGVTGSLRGRGGSGLQDVGRFPGGWCRTGVFWEAESDGALPALRSRRRRGDARRAFAYIGRLNSPRLPQPLVPQLLGRERPV